jgi:hypothetical protein
MKNKNPTPQNFSASPKDEFKNSVANMKKMVKPWRKSKMGNRKGREK